MSPFFYEKNELYYKSAFNYSRYYSDIYIDDVIFEKIPKEAGFLPPSAHLYIQDNTINELSGEYVCSLHLDRNNIKKVNKNFKYKQTYLISEISNPKITHLTICENPILSEIINVDNSHNIEFYITHKSLCGKRIVFVANNSLSIKI